MFGKGMKGRSRKLWKSYYVQNVPFVAEPDEGTRLVGETAEIRKRILFKQICRAVFQLRKF